MSTHHNLRNWMMERREDPAAVTEVKEETFDNCPQPPPTPRRKKNKINNKKRFSEEQIRLLETIFESETRLEPRRKLQIARELGLQPHQVAIWFQNRRARWKTKQIEHEYRTLSANYDSLASRFESLKKEKQSLLIQLQKLKENLGKPHDGTSRSKDLEGTKTDGGSGNGNNKCEPEAKLSFLQEGLNHEGFMSSHIADAINPGLYKEEDREILNICERTEDSLASTEKWNSFTSAGLFDQSCSSSHWLDFWT